jgi:hypothetical protein
MVRFIGRQLKNVDDGLDMYIIRVSKSVCRILVGKFFRKLLLGLSRKIEFSNIKVLPKKRQDILKWLSIKTSCGFLDY